MTAGATNRSILLRARSLACAIIGLLACSRASAPVPEEGGATAPPPRAAAREVPLLPAAPLSVAGDPAAVEPAIGSAPDGAPGPLGLTAVQRAQRCGPFGDLKAPSSGKDTFRLKRSELEASVNRFVSGELTYVNWGQPLPTKTQLDEVGFVMLRVGSKANCGLKEKDFLVRVNGKLLSNTAQRLELRALIHSASELVVELERDKKPLTLRYVLED
jgi:hypothetical protein